VQKVQRRHSSRSCSLSHPFQLFLRHLTTPAEAVQNLYLNIKHSSNWVHVKEHWQCHNCMPVKVTVQWITDWSNSLSASMWHLQQKIQYYKSLFRLLHGNSIVLLYQCLSSKQHQMTAVRNLLWKKEDHLISQSNTILTFPTILHNLKHWIQLRKITVHYFSLPTDSKGKECYTHHVNSHMSVARQAAKEQTISNSQTLWRLNRHTQNAIQRSSLV